MDPATLAETIRSAAFGTTQLRGGYDEVATDQLLDELVRAVQGGASGTDVAAIASNAKLPTTSMRRGYEYGEVDAFLDEVVRQATGAGAPTDAPVTSQPPPVTAGRERPALGARLVRLLRGD
ncbi:MULTISPECIES: DivIVA domain-containing protein [unclassified Knoellia]|uniref:DivIVA domain-containing protein n=1 Tax=Knoellia altitudinis TaxID=3404795 RepID=UPI003608716C